MSIRSELSSVLQQVSVAHDEPFKGHPLSAQLKGSAAGAVVEVIEDVTYFVEGSPGKGNWAETVWIAVFDPLVTETAQEGFYLVYLFRRDGTGVYLSLNQGTTAVLNEVGRSGYIEVLQDTAVRDAGLLTDNRLAGLQVGPINLSGGTTLTKGYEAGSIASVYYLVDEIPRDEVLSEDLRRFCDLYRDLISARDEVESSKEENDGVGKKSRVEAKRYRWHLRAERNSSLTLHTKKIHGDRCQVCGLRFEERYGKIADGYIEAHHLTPFSMLDGRPTTLSPNTDFAVVCANCHRMLHKGPPFKLEELRQRLVEYEPADE